MKRTKHLLAACVALCVTVHTASAQPVNDVCADVVPTALEVGATVFFSGNNEGATFDGDNVPGSGLDDFGVAVVWAAFTTTECADVSLSFCGSTAPFMSEFFWDVLAYDCPADELVVADSYNNADCSDGQPTVYFNELAAGTYYYPIWSHPGDAIGDYEIAISAVACATGGPANDLCSGAEEHLLATGDTLNLNGDNTGATNNDGLGLPVVWESFTLAQCADVTIDHCGSDLALDLLAIGIYLDCPTTMYLDTTVIDTCADGNLIMTFNDLAPGTYWVPVAMAAEGEAGPYKLNISAVNCTDGPPNDLCQGAVLHDLAVGDTLVITGDNTGATDTEEIGLATVWESFTLTECADVDLSLCGTDSTFLAIVPSIFTECPAINEIMGSDFSSCPDGSMQASFPDLAPGTYWLPVMMMAPGAEGPYTLTITAAACSATTPPNDRCEDALITELVSGEPRVFTGDNTGATDSEGLGFASVWEAITLTECSNLTLNNCGTELFTVFSTGIYTSCPATEVILPNDIEPCGSAGTIQTFLELPAGTYWIPVLMDPDNASGPYTLEVTALACTVPPANDLCEDAAPISVVTPDSCAVGAVVGDNLHATGSGDLPHCAEPGVAWQDVWYEFNAGDAEEVMITLEAGTMEGAGMEVFGACGDSLICTLDGGPIALTVMPDSTYRVRVFTMENGTPGTFVLCVTTDGTTGIGSSPAGSVLVHPNPGTGDFHFTPSMAWTDANIRVLDVTGRTIHSEQADLRAGEPYPLLLSGKLLVGTYFLHISGPAGSNIVKLMVK